MDGKANVRVCAHYDRNKQNQMENKILLEKKMEMNAIEHDDFVRNMKINVRP